MNALALVRATVSGTTFLSKGWLAESKARDRLWVLPLALAGIAAGLGVFEYLLVQNYRGIYAIGTQLGKPEMLIFTALLVSWVFTFIGGVPISLSVLYFSKDTRLLLSLPLRSSDIVISKTLLLWFYTIPIHVAVYVPAFVIWVLHQGASFAAILGFTLQLLLAPIFPLCLSVLLLALLMRLVNISRSRTTWEVVGMLLLLVLLAGFQVLFTRTIMSSVEPSTAGQPPAAISGVLSSAFSAIPPAAWAAESYLPGRGVLYSLIFVLFLAAVAALMLVVVQRRFLWDLMERSQAEKGTKRRRRSRVAEGTQAYRLRDRRLALLSREWRILSSQSAFIFEAAGEVLILPIMLAMMAIVLPAVARDAIGSLLPSIPVPSLIALALLVLFSCTNTVSSTSLSREGRAFSLSLTLPVAGRTQLSAKLLLHLSVFFPAFLMNTLIVFILLRLPPVHLLFFVPAGAAYLVVSFMTSILVDLRKPFLTWSHPQQAMKQNMNALGGMGIALLAILICGLATFGLYRLFSSEVIAGFGALAIGVALDVVLYPRLAALADRQYGSVLEC